MERYEGAKMIKTFRGLIADSAQDTVILHTNNGSTGYRITKFQLFNNDPGGNTTEHVVKIFKVSGKALTNLVDFSDNTLLAAAHIGNSTQTYAYPPLETVIFDTEIFNQDIYIVHRSEGTAQPINYYIELEQVKLDLNESTVATLKDVRNLEYPAPGG